MKQSEGGHRSGKRIEEDFQWTDISSLFSHFFHLFIAADADPSRTQDPTQSKPKPDSVGSLNVGSSLLCLSDTSFCPLKRIVKPQLQPILSCVIYNEALLNDTLRGKSIPSSIFTL